MGNLERKTLNHCRVFSVERFGIRRIILRVQFTYFQNLTMLFTCSVETKNSATSLAQFEHLGWIGC